MGEKLTEGEKGALIGTFDSKKADDYDDEFLKELENIELPRVDEIDPRIRRAVFKFLASHLDVSVMCGGEVALGIVCGYIVGQRLHKNIRNITGKII